MRTKHAAVNPEIDLDQSGAGPPPDARTSIHSRGAGMNTFEMLYLALVVAVFLGFAVTLAYYSDR